MDTLYFKDLLNKEKLILEKELNTLGRKNPDRKGDWETTEQNNVDEAEEGEVAENLAELDDNRNNMAQLETRLAEVNSALEKIEHGEYGKCEVCENKIEEDRLDANPAATTCKIHMNQ